MRSAQIKRDTAETKITLSLNIDGEGKQTSIQGLASLIICLLTLGSIH